MSFLKSRLRRLEAAKRVGPCPECKLPPDGPGYIVVHDEGEERPKDPDERCGSCGRFLWFFIEVVYDDDPPGEAAGGRWP